MSLTSTVGALVNTEKAVLVLSTPPSTYTGSSSSTSSLSSATASALSGTTSTTTSSSTHTLTLQYNPSSINFQANAQSVPFQYLQQNLDQGIPNMDTRPPSIVMTVDLHFDDMNVTDSFASETFSVDSVSDAVSTVASVVTNVAGDGYSVQPETNGLMAAVMSEITRNVTFRWSNMSFTGELSEVRARYTMFSTSGKPVRSIVTITITQQVTTDADSSAWNDAFDAAFGDSSSSVSSSVSTSIF